MSRTVDKRVVEMEFDNRRFEENVQTSISTLGKLKQSLDFPGASKGLEEVGATAKKLDMSPLSNAVETVSTKFSAMQVVAVTALANITNSAVNAGKRIISALTIDPIKTGFSEYELKMNSVQTIMASTGESIDTVNKYLEELNKYSDQTIYSFSDMTSNIGKFTNAGVKLEDAVMAIKGISNEAAVSGANSNEASRAMYNFAQAMSSGYVKLIDWKSIENANMATVEFKQNLIDTAVKLGTLRKKGDKYVSTTRDLNGKTSEAFSSTLLFNDSLSAQWMTSEVLVETLKNYADSTTEIGKKATKAATEVKTFTQLWDTLKESAQSGWATTWEIVVGDLEEAKVLLTEISDVFGGIIGNAAKERNDLIRAALGEQEDPSKMSGRLLLIDTVRNALTGIGKVLAQVREAFREIFPPITAQQLYSFIERIHELSKKLIAGDETLSMFKRTFEGVFAIFDIGVQIVKALLGVIKPFFAAFAGSGGTILDTTASLGDFFVTLSESLKTTDFFAKKLSKVAEIMGILGGVVASTVSGIKESFLAGGGGLAGVIQIAFDSVIKAFKGFVDIIESLTGFDLSGVENAVVPVVTKIRDVLVGFINSAFHGELASKISEFVQNLKNAFAEFKNVDTSGVESVSERLKMRFEPLVKLAEGISKVFSVLFKIIQKVSPIIFALIGKLGELIGGVSEKIATAVDNADFDSFIDIFNVFLTGGILIGIKKFIKSLTDISESAGGFLDKLKGVLDGVKGSLEAWQGSLKANTLLKIAGAVAILAISLIALSCVDSDKLQIALLAITAMFVELFTSMTLFSKTIKGDGFNAMGKVSTAMIAMAVAVLILSAAMTKIAALDPEGVALAIQGTAAMMMELVAAAKLLSMGKQGVIKGAMGFVLFAAALNIMAKAVERLSVIEPDKLKNGIAGLGAIMGELVIFSKLTKGSGGTDTLTFAASMILLAGALAALAGAVAIFANMDTDGMTKGLVAVGVLLAEIAVFTKLTNKSANITTTAIGMTVLAGAMVVLASAIKILGDLSWEELGKGLVGITGSLAAMAIILKAMNKVAPTVITTAGAFAIISVAMIALAVALKMFAGIDLAAIGKGLLAMAGSFLVLGVAAALLQTLTPAITALSYSLLMIGAAAAAVGVGFAAIAAGLYILKQAGPGVADVLVAIGNGLISLLPVLAEQFGAAMVALIKAAAEALPALGILVKALITTVVDIIVECAPKIVQGVISVVSAIIAALAGIIPSIVTGLVSFLRQILDGLRSLLPMIGQFILDTMPIVTEATIALLKGLIKIINDTAPDVISCVINMITELLKKLAEKMPEIIQAGMDIIVALLEGVANNIGQITQKAIDIANEFIKGISSKLGEIIDTGIKLIIDFVNGLADGIRNNTDAMIAAVDNLMDAVIEAIVKWFTHFAEKGKEIVDKIKEGIKNKMAEAKEAITEVVKGMVQKIKDKVADFKQSAKDLVDGLIQGIKDKVWEAANAAKDMAENVWNAITDFFKINSPSKRGIEAGQFIDEGIAIGLKRFAGQVGDSATDVGKTAIKSLSNTLSDISGMVEDEVNAQPTIRPVLDLSDVESGVRSLDTMFGETQAIRINASMSRSAVDSQNGTAPTTGGNTYQFTQNNYSPKALSRLDIYRQTKNQFSAMKEVLGS